MTFKKIKEIIVEQLEIEDVGTIKETTSLINDLEVDSLDIVEIIIAIEEEFDVEIPDEEAEEFSNIGDILSFVDANK